MPEREKPNLIIGSQTFARIHVNDLIVRIACGESPDELIKLRADLDNPDLGKSIIEAFDNNTRKLIINGGTLVSGYLKGIYDFKHGSFAKVFFGDALKKELDKYLELSENPGRLQQYHDRLLSFVTGKSTDYPTL